MGANGRCAHLSSEKYEWSRLWLKSSFQMLVSSESAGGRNPRISPDFVRYALWMVSFTNVTDRIELPRFRQIILGIEVCDVILFENLSVA